MTSISTSTSAFFDRAKTDIGSLRKRAEVLQEQLGSGDKLTRSSDDPVAASRLRVLSRANELSAIDKANSDRANADLTLADSALSTFSDYIIRAKELATTAANGTLNWADGDSASKSFNVPITNDTTEEQAETFTATLTNATGGATIAVNNS